MDVSVIVAKILPVVLLVLTGQVLRRLRFVDQAVISGLKKIVVGLSLPALLFRAFAGTEFELKYLAVVVAVFSVCLLMLGIGNLAGRFIPVRNRYLPAIYAGFETGMMGYAIFVSVFGTSWMHSLAVVDLGQVTFVFFVLVGWLRRQEGHGGGFPELLKSFVRSPVILSIVAGIIVGSMGLVVTLQANALWQAFDTAISLVAGLTTPLICLVIGYELELDLRRLGWPVVVALSRMAALALLAFAIDRLLFVSVLGLDIHFRFALYTMFLLPPPFVIPVFMPDSAEKERQFVLRTISIHVLLSLVACMFLFRVLPPV